MCINKNMYDLKLIFNIVEKWNIIVSVFHYIMIDTIQTTPKNLLEVPIGPMIRSRVKKLKDAFNELI
jgi:hypothetical protein